MNITSIETTLKEKIRDLNDWPQPGVIFRDITTLLSDAEGFKMAIDAMHELVKDKEFDKIVVVESRGFIFGSALAYKMGKGIVLVRKPGKLPCKTVSQDYQLEYGTDTLHMHEDAITKGEKVLLIDDLIATGGSSLATIKLAEKLGGKVVGALFLIELTFFRGRDILKDYNVYSVIKY